MNKEILFVILLVVCVVGVHLYQKKLQEDLLKELYQYKTKKDKDSFMKTLESNSAKMMFSKFTIAFMKFNYYADDKDYVGAKNQYQKFKDFKLNDKNFIALNVKMFNCALEAKDYTLASNIKKIVLPVLEKKKDQNSLILYGEIEQLDKIYIQKDTSILQDLLEALNQCEENEIKSLLCFRIAKLYHYLNDENKVNEYLVKAESYTMNVNNKENFRRLMMDQSGLD